MYERLKNILEMIRFSHTVFALPFAMLGAVMAWVAPVSIGAVSIGAVSIGAVSIGAASIGAVSIGKTPATLQNSVSEVLTVEFRWQQIVAILLCMIFARSAAMAFNRVVDRDIDAENPRTSKRHIPAGLLSLTSVVVFTIVCSLAFVLSTLLLLPNYLPLYLSIPVLLILMAYSYTKRFTALAHFWLGMSLMLAPICAWIAIRGHVVMYSPADLGPPALLGLSVLLWVAGFDMIYACQDFDFDVDAKLNSIPTMLGIAGALRLAAFCHFAMIFSLAALPLCYPGLSLGWIYGIGVAAVAILLAYEHWLVRPDDLTRVNIAFFNINAIVSMGLFLVTSIDLAS